MELKQTEKLGDRVEIIITLSKDCSDFNIMFYVKINVTKTEAKIPQTPRITNQWPRNIKRFPDPLKKQNFIF